MFYIKAEQDVNAYLTADETWAHTPTEAQGFETKVEAEQAADRSLKSPSMRALAVIVETTETNP